MKNSKGFSVALGLGFIILTLVVVAGSLLAYKSFESSEDTTDDIFGLLEDTEFNVTIEPPKRSADIPWVSLSYPGDVSTTRISCNEDYCFSTHTALFGEAPYASKTRKSDGSNVYNLFRDNLPAPYDSTKDKMNAIHCNDINCVTISAECKDVEDEEVVCKDHEADTFIGKFYQNNGSIIWGDFNTRSIGDMPARNMYCDDEEQACYVVGLNSIGYFNRTTGQSNAIYYRYEDDKWTMIQTIFCRGSHCYTFANIAEGDGPGNEHPYFLKFKKSDIRNEDSISPVDKIHLCDNSDLDIPCDSGANSDDTYFVVYDMHCGSSIGPRSCHIPLSIRRDVADFGTNPHKKDFWDSWIITINTDSIPMSIDTPSIKLTPYMPFRKVSQDSSHLSYPYQEYVGHEGRPRSSVYDVHCESDACYMTMWGGHITRIPFSSSGAIEEDKIKIKRLGGGYPFSIDCDDNEDFCYIGWGTYQMDGKMDSFITAVKKDFKA